MATTEQEPAADRGFAQDVGVEVPEMETLERQVSAAWARLYDFTKREGAVAGGEAARRLLSSIRVSCVDGAAMARELAERVTDITQCRNGSAEGA